MAEPPPHASLPCCRPPCVVAKRYKFQSGADGFKEDYQASLTARAMAAAFNAELEDHCPGTPRVKCLTVNRLLQLQGDTHYYCVEDFIEGDFCKYNNIFGDVEAPNSTRTPLYCELANSFSHFSFVRYAWRVRGIPCVCVCVCVCVPLRAWVMVAEAVWGMGHGR